MNTSAIEWTDRTWNPVSGCSHVSEGCWHCYAERFFPRAYAGRKFTEVQCHPERLDQPLKIKKPQKIFVNSMSDLFHEDVQFEFIDKVFAVISCCAQHTFQILTKRPARMLEYMNFDNGFGRTGYIWGAAYKIRGIKPQPGKMPPPFPYVNTWLGVSVEDQRTANERIPILLKTPAAVRWISAEPLLGPIDLVRSDEIALLQCVQSGATIERGLDWVVVGGESGPRARTMEISWANAIREQCALANVPFFMKQLSQNMLPRGFKDLENFPEYLRVREFPKTP